MGAVTPIGIGLEDLWSGIVSTRSGVSTITAFDHSDLPVHFAAEVQDFDPTNYVSRKEARHLDRFCQMALAAAKEAFSDSGIDMEAENPERIGCIWASGIGGLIEMESTHEVVLDRGPRRISPFFIPKLMVNAASGQIAIHLKLQGVNYAVSSACASGQHGIASAYRAIQYGDADALVTGGSEATISKLGIGGFCALRALSTRNDDPQTASRPFTADRDGFVVGEGAAGLVLEELERARSRGARIYGELIGAGMTDDAHHISAPLPDGSGAARSMRQAMQESGCSPDDFDYINAHGTSTQLNDQMETKAIRTAFGPHADALLVSSTKSQMGHLLGASGAVESVVSLLALHYQTVPATINYHNPDPECDLNYVPNETREASLRRVMSNSFGFGGHNVTLAFAKL